MKTTRTVKGILACPQCGDEYIDSIFEVRTPAGDSKVCIGCLYKLGKQAPSGTITLLAILELSRAKLGL